MLDILARLVLSEDPSADDDAYAVSARHPPLQFRVLNIVDGSGICMFRQRVSNTKISPIF